MKKLLSVLLVLAMTMTMLAGCAKTPADETKPAGNVTGSEAENEGGNTGEVVNLTFATLGTPSACQDEVVAAINEKLLADGLNISVTIKQIDDYWNKLALDIAGGTEYDLAWAHASTLADLVSKKVYQPITGALDTVGADLKAKTPDYILKGGSIGGEVYAIPRAIPTTDFSHTFDVRKDLMAKYGMDEITTLADLEKYFQNVLDNEDGMIPYMGQNIQVLFPVMGNYHYLIGDGLYALYVDPTDPELTVKNAWASEEYEAMFNKKLEWAEKGWLVDSDAVESGDQGFDYGKVAAVDSNVTRATERVDLVANNIPGGEVYTAYLEPDQRWICMAGDNMLAVPSTSKHVNEAVQLIQWFKCNQENYDLWSYGVKGENYELNGEAVDISNIAPEKVYSPMKWMWDDIDMARFSANYSLAESVERLKNWDSKSTQSPLLGFTIDQSKIKAEVSQILAIMSEYGANLGKGELKYADVKDEVLAKLDAAGIEKVIAEVQSQVDAYVGK